MMAAAMSSRGVFFLFSVRPEEPRRASLAGLIGGERFVRFPRTQPLVHHFHGKAKGFFDARRKTFCFFRHLARRAVQAQRKPDDNAANSFLCGPVRASGRDRAGG